MFSKDIGIDLGTANVLIFTDSIDQTTSADTKIYNINLGVINYSPHNLLFLGLFFDVFLLLMLVFL